MSKSIVETITGALVVIVAVGFGIFAYNSSNLQPVNGYELTARFSSVDGLGSGSEVRIGGIKVGVVSDMNLDETTYEALLTLQLKDGIKIPEDSSAGVVSAGLLGSKYVSVVPGGMEEMLADGDEIAFTQSAVNLESLIGKMVHSGGGLDKDSESSAKDTTSDDADMLKNDAESKPASTSGLFD